MLIRSMQSKPSKHLSPLCTCIQAGIRLLAQLQREHEEEQETQRVLQAYCLLRWHASVQQGKVERHTRLRNHMTLKKIDHWLLEVQQKRCEQSSSCGNQVLSDIHLRDQGHLRQEALSSSVSRSEEQSEEHCCSSQLFQRAEMSLADAAAAKSEAVHDCHTARSAAVTRLAAMAKRRAAARQCDRGLGIDDVG